jgi:AcrR family transcriptional regulator
MSLSDPSSVSLRERKKAKTRRLIREHGMRLFREQGYAKTTVDQIAEAAEVSPSTFFRYFPTKEDIVLADDTDPLMIAAFRAQPAHYSPLEALRRAMQQVVSEMPEEDWASEMERQELAMAIPELRAKLFDEYTRTIQMITEPLAERVGREPTDPKVRNFAGAVIGIAWAAWLISREDPKRDLMKRVDEGLKHLEDGLPL